MRTGLKMVIYGGSYGLGAWLAGGTGIFLIMVGLLAGIVLADDEFWSEEVYRIFGIKKDAS